jgi:hypothetical protein
MKKTNALFFLLVLSVVSVSAQTIRRVNNNPGVSGTNIYSGVQAAHDDAVNGDIIYIEPSPLGYDGLTSTKQLKIYGPGYFLDVNQELVGSQGKNAPMGSIVLNNGSAGTEIAGVEANGVQMNVSNVSLRRSRCGLVEVKSPNGDVSNIVIEQNFLYEVDVNTGGSSHLASNVIIQNNMGFAFSTSGFRMFTGGVTVVTSIIIRNNHIWDLYASNSLIENNLISRPDGGGITTSFTCTSCTVQNNVSAGALPAGNGNQSTVLVENEFVYPSSATLPAGITREEGFMLKNASPLKTAGTSGSEVGAFGGATPYVISGIPALPTISNLYVTPTGSASTPISVTVSTKSNN